LEEGETLLYWEIFMAFFIPGIVGYGGGPASIPLIHFEVVHRYGWLTVEEFGDVLALGNALPGPIATKMAGYIGYEIGGLFDGVVYYSISSDDGWRDRTVPLNLFYRVLLSCIIETML
jgi:chromate transport protein ChrA